METRSRGRRRTRVVLALASAALIPALVSIAGSPAEAAKSDGCANGGFSLVNLSTNTTVASGNVETTIPASAFAGSDRFGVGSSTRWPIRAAR